MTCYQKLLGHHDQESQSAAADLQAIDALLKSEGDDDSAIKRRDKGRHQLLDAAKKERDWQDIANHILRNGDDIRKGIYKRFLKECPFKDVSDRAGDTLWPSSSSRHPS